MTVIKFFCNGNSAPAYSCAYSCDTHGDNSGAYVPVSEVYDLAQKMKTLRELASVACALTRKRYGILDVDIDKELTRIEELCVGNPEYTKQ